MTARRLAILGVGVLSLSCLAHTGTSDVVHTFPVRTYTLPSGMRVVVEQDDDSNLVGVAWVVDVGQGDDPPARPGLAHLVEHLLLSLPDETGATTWRRLLGLGAGHVNAQTELDLTTAYAFAPRAALDELTAIFLARADEPSYGLDEERLAKERRVIDEEVALRESAGSPGSRLVLDALAGRTVFPAAPAVRAALGAITMDDVRAFVDAHYRPERMTLVLAGPIPLEWDRRFLAGLPADLAGGERRAPARHPLVAPVAAGTPRAEIASVVADVRERELWLAWPLPPARGRDEVPFRLTAALAERLLTREMEAGQLMTFTGASVEVFSSAALGAFIVRVDLRPGVDAAAARQEVDEALESLAALPVATWMEERRRRVELDLQAARLHEALGMESLVSRTLERARIAHDDPATGVADIVEATITSSLQGVADVVSRHLAGPPARSLLLTPRPGGRQTPGRAALPPRVARAAAGTADADERSVEEPPSTHDARAVVATAQGVGARGARVSRLANGLTLIVLRRPGLPVASMLLGFHAEPRPGERPGVRTAASLGRGFRLARTPLDRAILQGSFVVDDAYFDTLEMFAGSAEAAIDLLWDEASGLTVQWPLPAGESWLQRAALREATIDGHLTRALHAAAFGALPTGVDAPSAAVRAVSETDVRAWLERVRRPANGALVIVGDVPDAIAKDADDALSDWAADATAPAPPPAASPPPPDRGRAVPILTGIDPGRAWTKLQFGCVLPPARTPRDAVVGELLEEALGAELFGRLRVELGASYAPQLRRSTLRGGAHLLTGVLDVEPKAGPGARDLLRAWLDGAGTAAFDAQAIENARWRLARASGLRAATNVAIARRLFAAWNMGWPLESLDAYPQDLASVTPAEVAAALATCRASAVVAFLAPP